MASKQEGVQTHFAPLPGWFLRWGRWLVYGLVCLGYLICLLSEQQFTLPGVLLLTLTYSAWLATYYIGQRWLKVRSHPAWLLVLLCLACASQFIPLSGANLSWLPLIPTITVSLVTTLRPWLLSALAATTLWLSSSIAFVFISQRWDISSQLILLLSFVSTYGFLAAIRELAVAYSALESTNTSLAEAHTRLQAYNIQVEELSVIRERNRIAREIHDTLGHALTLLAVQLETATQLEARQDPRLHEELLEARQVAKACLTDVRNSVEALRPDEAAVSSLPERLQKLAATLEATCHETSITLDLEEATQPLQPEMSQALYRCAQEALTNIRKHARATKVLLRLSTSIESEGQVELTVLDNGQGTPSENDRQGTGFGLLGMRERVALLAGTLRAGPEPKQGWRVEVVFPLKTRERR